MWWVSRFAGSAGVYMHERLMDIGVCKVKPLYVVGGGCWGWQGQAS